MDILHRTDEELLSLCASSAEAQEVLINRYARLVRVFARRFFLLGGDYDDLVQEGMIGLLFAIRQYQPETGTFPNFAAYCIKNRLISAVRSAAAKKHAPLNDSVSISNFPTDYTPFDTVSVDPEEFLIDKERYSDYLFQLRQLLSPLERRIVDSYLEGLSCSEIAEQLQRPQKSVVNAVQRIKTKAASIFSRR